MWGAGQKERPSKVQDASLLPGERVVQLLSQRDGLVSEPQHGGPILALTDRRVLHFTERDGQRQVVMASLDEIQGATLKVSGRSSKPLFQGLALMVVALAAYLLIGTFIVRGVLIPAIVAVVIGVMGIYLVLRYIFWEEEGSLTLQARGWAFSFPYQVRRHVDALKFVESLFELKAAAQQAVSEEAPTTPPAEVPAPQPTHQEAKAPPLESALAPETPAAEGEQEQRERVPPESGAPGEERRNSADPGVGDDIQA